MKASSKLGEDEYEDMVGNDSEGGLKRNKNGG